jgi:hypothetical protein
MDFVIINGDKNHAIIPQKFPEQLEAGHHHTQPLVMAGQVFLINRAIGF